jgi:cell division control protein 6
VQSPKRNKSVYLKTSNNQNQETLYQKAKAVFRRTAVPSRLVGRGNERETMMDFWREHVLENKAGCLYISGMPGTGKTAMLTEVMRKMENEMMDLRTHKVKIVMVNCMTVKEPKQIYTKLIHGLGSPKTAIESDAAKQAEKMINNEKKVIK